MGVSGELRSFFVEFRKEQDCTTSRRKGATGLGGAPSRKGHNPIAPSRGGDPMRKMILAALLALLLGLAAVASAGDSLPGGGNGFSVAGDSLPGGGQPPAGSPKASGPPPP